jgi:hypothetical protein
MTRLPVDLSTVYICNLFHDDVRNSEHTASNDRMMVNELGRTRYEVADNLSYYYPGICPATEYTIKTPADVPDQDSNQTPPEYKPKYVSPMTTFFYYC